jgi:hypothetical protein
MEEKSIRLPFSLQLIYYVHQIKKRKRIMKILFFISGALFGAYCNAAVIKMAHSTVDFALNSFHAIVGLI